MYKPSIFSPKILPACLLGGVILVLLLCMAKFANNQQAWSLDSWDLPYADGTSWRARENSRC